MSKFGLKSLQYTGQTKTIKIKHYLDVTQYRRQCMLANTSQLMKQLSNLKNTQLLHIYHKEKMER